MAATIALFQHAASEGPGRVASWLEERGAQLEVVRWWESPAPKATAHWAGVVILGGAMNIYQHRDHPWLVEEKRLLGQLLARNLPILGICLGAQLLADQLGSRVVQNAEQEIGWWPVRFTDEARRVFPHLPSDCTVLHWHGDTFALPPESIRLAESTACGEQGFVWRDRVVGVQFHPEVNTALLEDFCGEGGEAWPTGSFVQSRATLLQDGPRHFAQAQGLLDGLLDRVFGPLAGLCDPPVASASPPPDRLS